jgi:hypothetical protein
MLARQPHRPCHRTPPSLSTVGPTPRISCEAVSPSVLPAGARGGTSACSTGAAVGFVSCIRFFDDTGQYHVFPSYGLLPNAQSHASLKANSLNQ